MRSMLPWVKNTLSEVVSAMSPASSSSKTRSSPNLDDGRSKMASHSCTLHYCGLHELLDDNNVITLTECLWQ